MENTVVLIFRCTVLGLTLDKLKIVSFFSKFTFFCRIVPFWFHFSNLIKICDKMKNMRQKMTKYALKMVKYAPKMAKYADYAKMHKNTVLCRKMPKYVNCIKNMHSHVFCSPNYY